MIKRLDYNKINVSSYNFGRNTTGYISIKRPYVRSIHNYKPFIMGNYIRYGVLPMSVYNV